jgi:hypothetical protein
LPFDSGVKTVDLDNARIQGKDGPFTADIVSRSFLCVGCVKLGDTSIWRHSLADVL